MYLYNSILESISRIVRTHLAHQCLDSGRDDFGCWYAPHYGMACADHTSHGQSLVYAGLALLAEDSPLAADGDLLHRVLSGIGFLKRAQRSTGLIDLPKVDFDSPPDTAFLVQALCPVLELARQRDNEGLDAGRQVDLVLSPVLLRAAKGIVGRGFKTPNHRWVVSSALAYAMTLLPELDAGSYVQSILAEGIDLNPDGDWSERSSSIYNAVCNRAYRLMAVHLDRPELLDPVRRNLDLTLHMLDADGSVVTAGSSRQDAGLRRLPTALADSFFDLAIRDGNGRFAEMADRLADSPGDEQNVWLLQPLLHHGIHDADSLPRQPLPDRYEKIFSHSGVWRVREGELSVTAIRQLDTPLQIRFGHAEVSVRIHHHYFHTGPFVADAIERTPDGVILRQTGSCDPAPGWDLPLGRPIEFEDPHHGYYQLARDGTRNRWTLPPLDLALRVQRIGRGFDLTLTTAGGVDRIPVVIDLVFPPGGNWESEDIAMPAGPGQHLVLKQGYGVYHRGGDALRVGPGANAHRCFVKVPKEENGLQVRIPLLTPVTHTLSVRFGPWSEARRDLAEADTGTPCSTHTTPSSL